MKSGLILALVLTFTACSQAPRKPSSTIYTCHFSENIQGTDKHFEFVPDDHSLMVDKADVAMEESDFASGAFVYKSAKSEKAWKAELVFMSFEPKAQVYLKLVKSPFSSSPLTIVKDCE